MKKSVTLLTSLLLSTAAYAGPGFYVELAAGKADNSVDSTFSYSANYEINGESMSENESESFSESIGKSTSFGARLGYQFNDYIAVELGHQEYGEKADNYVDDFGDNISDKISSSSTSLGVKGILPVSESFALFVRAGYAKWDLESKSTDSSLPGETFRFSESDNDITYGIGAEYMITESMSLGLEYSVIEMNWDESDSDSYTSDNYSYSYASTAEVAYKVENISLLFKYTF